MDDEGGVSGQLLSYVSYKWFIYIADRRLISYSCRKERFGRSRRSERDEALLNEPRVNPKPRTLIYATVD